MTKADDHTEQAVRAYIRYMDRQRAIDDFENEMVSRAGGYAYRLLASLNLRDQQYYRLTVGTRNAFQDQMRSEAAMAIVGLLMDIRSLLRGIAKKENQDNPSGRDSV